jgi:ankyrin repeat protein
MKSSLLQSIEEDDSGRLRQLIDSESPTVTLLNEALRKAVRLGRIEMMHLLIQRGAEVSTRDPQTGWSLLHTAVEHGMKESIRVLAKAGADINALNDGGQTPLHLAVDAQTDAAEQIGALPDLSTIRLLLELGADRSIRDNDGRTASDWAADAGVELLRNALR